MDEQTINNLREALQYSPDNFPLRLHLAETLMRLKRHDEAEQEYRYLVGLKKDARAMLGLANVYYEKSQYSTCCVILEEALQQGMEDTAILVLLARALLKEGSLHKAADVYQRALQLDPEFRDDELDSELRLGVNANDDVTDDHDPRFLQKPAIRFADVGGMEKVKKEIEMKILKPMLHPELYKAYGKKAGGGILLYGPPGCGKTYVARATAGEASASFINVGLNDILDMWVGNSEKNLHAVFELARANKPCVLFIDEIDALGASRSDMKHSASRHLINQFLQELDGVDSDNDDILIMGATNTPWNLDAAFRRPGRFDRIIFVPPPDEAAREMILQLKLKDKPVEDIDHRKLARKLEHYSGADIEAIIDIAVEAKLEEAFKDGIPKPLSTRDLLDASGKHKPSTRDWFSTAKNFALYANDSGLYDEILTYIKK